MLYYVYVGVQPATKRKETQLVKSYQVEGNGKKATFKTRAAALLFATTEHNRTKAATGQKVRFIIKEL